MKKLVILLVLGLSFIGGVMTVNAVNSDVYFVANSSDLNVALQQKDALKGMALSGTFYASLSQEKKQEVQQLIRHLLALTLRPVFVYGQPLNADSVKELLKNENGSGCKPSFFAGVFPTKRPDGSDSVTRMCGADDKNRSEEWLRNFIAKYWTETKRDLKKRGHSVLE